MPSSMRSKYQSRNCVCMELLINAGSSDQIKRTHHTSYSCIIAVIGHFQSANSRRTQRVIQAKMTTAYTCLFG